MIDFWKVFSSKIEPKWSLNGHQNWRNSWKFVENSWRFLGSGFWTGPGGVWSASGRVSGGFWTASGRVLGPFWRALGGPGGPEWRPKWEKFVDISLPCPRMPPGEGLGRIWEGFWEDFVRIWKDLGRILNAMWEGFWLKFRRISDWNLSSSRNAPISKMDPNWSECEESWGILENPREP